MAVDELQELRDDIKKGREFIKLLEKIHNQNYYNQELRSLTESCLTTEREMVGVNERLLVTFQKMRHCPQQSDESSLKSIQDGESRSSKLAWKW